jgi:hypothetical protein
MSRPDKKKRQEGEKNPEPMELLSVIAKNVFVDLGANLFRVLT